MSSSFYSVHNEFDIAIHEILCKNSLKSQSLRNVLYLIPVVIFVNNHLFSYISNCKAEPVDDLEGIYTVLKDLPPRNMHHPQCKLL